MTTGQIGTSSPPNMSETALTMPKRASASFGDWFAQDYIPRHCAANGIADSRPFLDPDHEPPPAICPHCGRELRYTRRFGNRDTGEIWGWEPIPEECDNPRCQEMNRKAREREEMQRRMERLRNALDPAGIPRGEYRHVTAGSYNPQNKSQRDALEIVKKYQNAMSSDVLRGTRGLYICGPVGTGKTHLAVAIARAAIWADHLVRFTGSFEMLEAVKRSRPEDDLIGKYCDASLLVLDDIGKEYSTPWAMKQLERLINARISAGLPTVYTSNYPLQTSGNTKDLMDALSQHGDADCAAAIVSRIGGSTDTVMVLGDDYRVSPHQE